jgi:hypothetical protein
MKSVVGGECDWLLGPVGKSKHMTRNINYFKRVCERVYITMPALTLEWEMQRTGQVVLGTTAASEVYGGCDMEGPQCDVLVQPMNRVVRKHDR